MGGPAKGTPTPADRRFDAERLRQLRTLLVDPRYVEDDRLIVEKIIRRREEVRL